MKEVTKAEFRDLYFSLGGGDATGWSVAYWNKFFENDPRTDMKYSAEEPPTPEHTRMMIVVDTQAKEYRLFFMTEESEDSLFDFPGKDD